MFASMTMDAEGGSGRRPVEENHASALTPTDSRAADSGPDEHDVELLREMLRAAEHSYHGYLGELRQGDVEPVEDWSRWYAEYLLGLR
jgi:hypothetical protein